MNFETNIFQGDILIVDDLADNLRVLSDTLSVEGHRVRGVRNG
jgi:CheY-like chemotaxis protein